jgi:hypothetical protein
MICQDSKCLVSAISFVIHSSEYAIVVLIVVEVCCYSIGIHLLRVGICKPRELHVYQCVILDGIS